MQFRKWATRVVEELTVKGFAMDDERLKRGGSVLSELEASRSITTSSPKSLPSSTDHVDDLPEEDWDRSTGAPDFVPDPIPSSSRRQGPPP